MNVENTYSNNLEDNLIFNITYKRNDNLEYITKNIKKISKIKPEKILYKQLDKNINKFIYESLNKNNFDIIVIYSNNKIVYNYNFTPLFPILIDNNNNKVFILTSIQAELLNGFNKKCDKINDYFNDFIYRCTKLYGGLISNIKISNYEIFEDDLKGFKEMYRSGIFKNYNINNVKNTNYIKIKYII
jgi:hypothetical protein